MDNFYQVTLVVQIISVIIIGFVMLYFAKIYKQKYLKYWSYSFISLSIFLFSALLSFLFHSQDNSLVFILKLSNVFILSLAGYAQLAFLILGTRELIHKGSITKRNILWAFVLVITLSLFVTFYKSWSENSSQIRYLLRIGIRYFVAGITFVTTAIYLLRKHATPKIGKRFVIVFFSIYGLEMLILSLFILEYFWKGSSQYLFTLVYYHGLFELMVYPFISLGLVMWLLEVERERSVVASNILFNLNKTDALTGLPNRSALDSFYKSWKSKSTQASQLTFVLLGVDKLQRINDAEGIKKVDILLVELSKKIDSLFQDDLFLGRLHGDIFIGVIDGYSDKTVLKSRKIRNQLSQTLNSLDNNYQIKMSAGIVRVDSDMLLEKILYNANISLQSAKENGGNCSVVYVNGLKLLRSPDFEIENELRLAYKHEQFEMYYQPIWSNNKQCIVSFEALIRWNHPTKGILTPAAFMHGIIQLDRMKVLDLLVLKTVIKQIREWQDQGLETVPIAINFSPDTLESYDIIESIVYLTDKYKVNKHLLTIEITENTAMKNIESGKNTLSEISKLGLKIAVDDFGTGYSSLNYLKTFPSDIIKFDRSFITHLKKHDINHEILKSLVPLCHRLKKEIIIEGVEQVEQVDILSELNISGFQGYYFSYPVKSAQAALMMKNKSIHLNEKEEL